MQLGRLFDGLTRSMNALGTSLVVVIMLVVLADVLGRGLFSTPLAGTPEIVAVSVTVIVFLQFPSTLASGRVIAADGALGWIGRRSPRTHQWLLSLHHAVGAALFAITTRHLWPLVESAWRSGDYYGSTATLTLAKWPVYAVILFGCGILSAQYMVLSVAHWKAGVRRVMRAPQRPEDKVLG
jgi:TRAP-type mannitol/chloroaromatic compound transport system permease small subunit